MSAQHDMGGTVADGLDVEPYAATVDEPVACWDTPLADLALDPQRWAREHLGEQPWACLDGGVETAGGAS